MQLEKQWEQQGLAGKHRAAQIQDTQLCWGVGRERRLGLSGVVVTGSGSERLPAASWYAANSLGRGQKS